MESNNPFYNFTENIPDDNKMDIDSEESHNSREDQKGNDYQMDTEERSDELMDDGILIKKKLTSFEDYSESDIVFGICKLRKPKKLGKLN